MITAIADVLRDYGVDLAYPDRRIEKARVVAEAGVDADGFGCWCREVEVSCGIGDPKVPRIIAAAILEGPKRVQAAVGDAIACSEARSQRADPKASYGVAERSGPDLQDEARVARIAFCRQVSDRKPVETVAAELGMSLPELARLVEIGRDMQAPRLPNQGPSRVLPVIDDKTREKSFDEMRRRAAARIPQDRQAEFLKTMHAIPRTKDLLRSELARNEGFVRFGGDKARRAAIADLEASGEWIMGKIDGDGNVRVQVVPPKDRAALVQQRRAVFQDEMMRGGKARETT
ncbi:MAG: hypothetical protein IPK26_25890 [Planctomycetes bacterium]|nr:hypothetical protein [Planctomycetota bacterium]